MKTLLSVLLALLVAAPAAVGATDPPKEERSRTQSMADQAKAARGKRKKSTTKVITNADVKKSGGRIIENSGAMTPIEPAPTQTLTEKQAAERKARQLADSRVAAAQGRVADLEKELAAIEHEYYEENDLDRRDHEVVKRFEDVNRRLKAARKTLTALLAEPPTAE